MVRTGEPGLLNGVGPFAGIRKVRKTAVSGGLPEQEHRFEQRGLDIALARARIEGERPYLLGRGQEKVFRGGLPVSGLLPLPGFVLVPARTLEKGRPCRIPPSGLLRHLGGVHHAGAHEGVEGGRPGRRRALPPFPRHPAVDSPDAVVGQGHDGTSFGRLRHPVRNFSIRARNGTDKGFSRRNIDLVGRPSARSCESPAAPERHASASDRRRVTGSSRSPR